MFMFGSTANVSSVRFLCYLQKFRNLSNLLFRDISSSAAKHKGDKYQNIWTEDFDSFLKMSKSKEFISTEESSSEEDKPKRKVKKTERKEKKEAKPEPSKKAKSSEKTEDEEQGWNLGNQRFVKINEFKGKTYVNIREMYMDKATNELKPGIKGISLTPEQWKELVSLVGEIDKAVKTKG